MKTIKTSLLLIILFLSNINNSYSKLSDTGFEENEDYIEIIDIENIYAPQRLREIFNYYTNLDLSKKDDRKIVNKIKIIGEVKTIEEYLKLFKEKFIVVEITKLKYKNDCGKNNYDISIVINPKSMEGLVITITEDNKICRIMDDEIRYKRYRYKYLINKYSNYWL